MINSKTMEEKKVSGMQSSTDTSVPGSIIIAPRIESMEVTIVMGDQKSSYMNFNGGEAYVDEPYDDGDFGEDGFEDEDIGEGSPDEDGIATVPDEVDHSFCAECDFTDCTEHPQNRKAQKLKEGPRPPREWQPPRDTQQPNSAPRSKDGIQTQDTRQAQDSQQNSKFKITDGDAALEGMPEPFKLIIEVLKAAGLNLKVQMYEEKEDQSDE